MRTCSPSARAPAARRSSSSSSCVKGQKRSRSWCVVTSAPSPSSATATSRWCGSSGSSGIVHPWRTRPGRPARSTSRSATLSPEPSLRTSSQLRDVTATSPPGRSTLAMPASAARRAARPAACVSELPTQKTASKPAQPCCSSCSQAQRRASTSTPRSCASRRVRSTIAPLASEATTRKPRSASPTASCPVPAAQSSTRAPGSSASTTAANAAALPSGVSSASGTSQS